MYAVDPENRVSGVGTSFLIDSEKVEKGAVLGQGSFGVVYKGVYQGRVVALKEMLSRSLSVSAQDQFIQELQVMATFGSPYIVTFYGYVAQPGYGIVMEYMPNGSLYEVLHSQRPLDWAQRGQMAADIARGLGYIHEKGILHRDLKSLNVLLTDGLRAKLSDFGLAMLKVESSSVSSRSRAPTASVGTLAWMAPELFKRRAIFTTASDVYSYGMVLWEIAARQIPFADAANRDLIPTWVKEGEREEIPVETPPVLARIIQECWQGEASMRPRVSDMIEQLRDFDRPIARGAAAPLASARLDGGSSSVSSASVSASSAASVPTASSSVPAGTALGAPLTPAVPAAVEQALEGLMHTLRTPEALQEDLDLYIPPNGSHHAYAQQVFDLMSSVQDFLRSDKRVLLLLGDSGAGKSLFGQYLMKQLVSQATAAGPLPLFIYLPMVRQPTTHLLTETFQHYGFRLDGIEVLKKTKRWIFFLDAYDEMNQWQNVYVTNHLDEWSAKVIISCRTSYLASMDNYRRYFIPYLGEKRLVQAFQEVYVAPFVSEQVSLYVTQYLQVRAGSLRSSILLQPELSQAWLQAETYLKWIEEVPGLSLLVHNPFLLKIAMEVLPEVVSEYQATQDTAERFKMTSVRLYDTFIRKWFMRQEDKLIAQGESVSRHFHADCMAFAKALAKTMHQKGVTQVQYEEASLLTRDGEAPAANEWDFFFSDRLLPEDKGSVVRQSMRISGRKACPLRPLAPHVYAFIHSALLDYFVSLVLTERAMHGASSGTVSSPSLTPPPAAAAMAAISVTSAAGVTAVQPSPSSGRLPAVPRKDTAGGEQGENVEKGEKAQKTERVEGVAEALPSRVPQYTKDGRRLIGDYQLMNAVSAEEAAALAREEGLHIVCQPPPEKTPVILGRGQYGKFRLARHTTNQRFAGVKKIRGEAGIGASQQESDIQMQLNGQPHIMPIWQSMTERDWKGKPILYQFMPLAGFGNGEMLRDVLPFLLDSALKASFLRHMAHGLLTGVVHMHRRRIYHLDLKPANVVLDSRGMLYIIDFGCAVRQYDKKEEVSLERGNGDIYYCSPERIALRNRAKQGASASALLPEEPIQAFDAVLADSWAVGLTLLEMVLGCYPLEHVPVKIIFSQWNRAYFEEMLHQKGLLALPHEDPLLDVIQALLCVDPAGRMTPEKALASAVFQGPAALSGQALVTAMADLLEAKSHLVSVPVFTSSKKKIETWGEGGFKQTPAESLLLSRRGSDAPRDGSPTHYMSESRQSCLYGEGGEYRPPIQAMTPGRRPTAPPLTVSEPAPSGAPHTGGAGTVAPRGGLSPVGPRMRPSSTTMGLFSTATPGATDPKKTAEEKPAPSPSKPAKRDFFTRKRSEKKLGTGSNNILGFK